MKDQVTSLPVSKELAELMPGVETELYWVNDRLCVKINFAAYRPLDEKPMKHFLDAGDTIVPAYTLTEILRVLPDIINYKGREFKWRLTPEHICYYEYFSDLPIKEIIGDSHFYHKISGITESTAQLCIWTIKEGYLKITDGGG
jgi:hypothetical protein